jgi:hypothetical protein
MKNRYFLLLPLLAFFSCGTNPDPKSVGTPELRTFKNCLCSDTTLNPDSLCSQIPHEVLQQFLAFDYHSNMSPKFQPSFDLFSWQSFVALNWPADANGNPLNASFRSNTTNLRVWENFVLADTVFIPSGGAKNPKLKLVLKPGDARAKKQLYQMSKLSQNITINDKFLEADGSTLIDKNLNYVLYEERMNNDEWNYISNNHLRTEKGQQDYIQTANINLPAGTYDGGPWGKSTSGQIGSIEVKASWRILDPSKGDDTNRYYHQLALITIDGSSTWSGNSLNFTAMVGLVGLHIIHKTEIFQRQIWSSFEQIDNAPDSAAVDPSKIYSFYNTTYLGAPYQRPGTVQGKKAMWNDVAPYALAYAVDAHGNPGTQFGSQVPRYYSIYFTTDSINKAWQAKLSGTVWQYYKLIGTQWFSAGLSTKPQDIPNAPVYLGNTTLESYNQNDASCTSCHAGAVIAGTPQDSVHSPRYSSDFSFLFGHAGASSDFVRQKPKGK